MIELRALTADDLPRVAGWMSEPHVARWWLHGTTAEAEMDEIRERITGTGDRATRLLTVLERREPGHGVVAPIGWCQWYPYDAYPLEAAAIGAQAGDCGIDYAIGESGAIGRGCGTELIDVLVREVRTCRPGCGVIVDPDATNAASRRVLERNGFSLVAVRSVATEPHSDPVAIYRLPGLAELMPSVP